MKKRNVIITILIVILLIILAVTLYTRFNLFGEKNKLKSISTLVNELTLDTSNLVGSEVKIDDYVDDDTEVAYDSRIIINNNELNYRLYIDDDDKLVLKDNTNYKSKILGNMKFKTIYVPDSGNYSEIYIYALSLDGDVYLVYLNTSDVNDATLEKLNRNYKVKNFTYLFVPYVAIDNTYIKNAYVITTDNKIYDVMTNTIFMTNAYNFQNEYMVYDDSTISNQSGYFLHNDKKEKYKLKYMILLNDNVDLDGNPDILIITDNDDLIYSINKKLYKAIYKVKSLDTKRVDDKILVSKIRFSSGDYIDIDGIRYSVIFEEKSFDVIIEE